MNPLALGRGVFFALTKNFRKSAGAKQSLDIYYDEEFAKVLENWGVDTAWREIQFLLGDRTGRVLDLACGTGRAHDFIKRFPGLDYHGCDISDLLIGKAVARGIAKERLLVQDATRMTYEADAFDYVFSIGSLEHFTVDGLKSTLRECDRICAGINLHHIPVSRTGLDEGWQVTAAQSYWNNSESWWLKLFGEVFGRDVWVLRSHWSSSISRGIWVVSTRKGWLR